MPIPIHSSPIPSSHLHPQLSPSHSHSGWALLHLLPGAALHWTGLTCDCACACDLHLHAFALVPVLGPRLRSRPCPPPPPPPTTTYIHNRIRIRIHSHIHSGDANCVSRISLPPPQPPPFSTLRPPSAAVLLEILLQDYHDHVQIKEHSSSAARNRQKGPNVENKVFTARPICI